MRHLFFFTLFFYPIFAGNISGIVIDESNNNPLFGANVSLSSLNKGSATNKNGEFVITDIRSGIYDLEVSVIGYKNYSKSITVRQDNNPKLIVVMDREPLTWKAINVIGMFPSKHSPEITQIINRDNLMKNEIFTLSGLLKTLHGFDLQMAHEYGRNVNISIRGSSDYKPGGYNNRVLLLVDGIPASIPNSGAPDWNAIPLENIDRIEIVRGPASSLYGHNSMGGVINMVTRSKKPNNLSTYQASFGSFNKSVFQLNYNRNIKNINVFTTAGYNSSSGHRFNAYHENIRGSVKIKSQIGNYRKWSLSAIITRSSNGQPGFDYPENPAIISYRQSERTSGYLHIFYSQPIFNDGILSSSIGLNQFNTIYNDRNDTPPEKIQGQTEYKDQIKIWRNEYQKFFTDKSILTIGTEAGFDGSRSDVINAIYVQPKQRTIGAFTQFKKPFKEYWILDIGLRYDYRQVQGGNLYPIKLYQAVSPKFNLYFKPHSNKQYHLSLNRGFRAPSISELFLEHESSYGLQFRGNPKLQPEFMTAAEIGFKELRERNQTWFLNMFYNYYSNMIDFVYTIPVESLNRTNVVGFGLELGFSNIILPLNLGIMTMNYSHLQMEDLQDKGPILYRPKHKVKVGIDKQVRKINIGVSFNYKSPQQYENFLSSDHPIIDNIVRFPVETIPEISLFDLQVSKRISNIEIALNINNIFNKDYVLIQNYPMPGKTWQINLSKIIK
mgnify:FL=1